jgi:hypothetical protein
MADNLNGGAHRFSAALRRMNQIWMANAGLEQPSLKRKRKSHYAHTKSIHLDRAFGGDCHHGVIDGDTDARTPAGEETSADGNLPGESAPMDTYLVDVHLR